MGNACSIVLSEASGLIYDGTAKTPGVTVRLDGKTLVKGSDYTVSYSDNMNAGTAKVVVTGAGDYAGEASTTFTIAKAAQSALAISADSVLGQLYVGDGFNLQAYIDSRIRACATLSLTAPGRKQPVWSAAVEVLCAHALRESGGCRIDRLLPQV